MSIKYIKHIDINKKKWDSCIDMAENSLVYANSWYLDIVCENWDALILDDYSAVMPLPWKRKYGIKYIYHPFFSQQLGVFFTDASVIEVSDFIKQIPKSFIKYEFALNNRNKNHGVKANLRTNYLLQLNKTHSDIIAAYNVKCRRNVKLSKKEEVSIDALLPVGSLLHLKRENMINSLSETHFEKMKNLLTFLIDNNSAKIVGVYNNDKTLLGAAAFIFYKKRIVYLFSASTLEGKKKRVMYRILDHIIGENSNSDMCLDFEGSMIDNIARFFKSFNAKTETYYSISKSRIPFFK